MKIGLSLKSNHQIKLRLSKYLIHMVVKEHSSYLDTKNKNIIAYLYVKSITEEPI